MRIAFTELEFTLLAGFNIYNYINDKQTKERTKEAINILIEATKEDTHINNLLLLAESALNGTIIKHVTDLMMEQDPHSKDFRACERMIINHATNPRSEKNLLQACYTQLIALSAYQTNSNEAEVLEAMENIEAIQERLYQASDPLTTITKEYS